MVAIRFSSLCSLASVFLLLGLAGCAAAPEPRSTSTPAAHASRVGPHQPTRDLGEKLYSLIGIDNLSDDTDGKQSNYADIRYDGDTIHLYWVGSLPAKIRKAIDRAPEIDVVVHEEAPYTAQRLLQAQDELVDWLGDGTAIDGVTFTFIERGDDGASLDISIIDTTHSWTAAELETRFAEKVGLPVNVSIRK